LPFAENPEDVYKYTAKGNLVAVISNGTAVLGLGDIGAAAGKPVMEGKGLLFKIYADIDCFDLELDTKNVDEFVRTVKILEPTFGGVNLEDISAPECFEIEERLKKELNIPVMHDDQHGTAIISAAALLNALELVGKDISNVKIVVNGAGALLISCTRPVLCMGAQKSNVFMFDSKGLIHPSRTNLDGKRANSSMIICRPMRRSPMHLPEPMFLWAFPRKYPQSGYGSLHGAKLYRFRHGQSHP
jgi:malate dehydrogenase (oxaloacetate-decarboxylating)(NADP+)